MNSSIGITHEYIYPPTIAGCVSGLGAVCTLLTTVEDLFSTVKGLKRLLASLSMNAKLPFQLSGYRRSMLLPKNGESPAEGHRAGLSAITLRARSKRRPGRGSCGPR